MSGAAAPEPVAPAYRKIWVTGAIALAVLAALIAVETPGKSGLQALWYDGLQIVSPRQIESTPATVVAIDEKSLAALGQWPWPRTTLARLIDAIARYEPLAIGVDILMPESDRLSPAPAFDAAGAPVPTHDAQLARAIAAAPVVMALAGMPVPTGTVARVPMVTVVASDATSGVAPARRPDAVQLRGVIRSIDLLDDAAVGHGVISAAHLEDVIRRVPLVFDIDGTLAPALTTEMLRIAFGEPRHRVHVDGRAVRGVSIGNFAAPTESDGAVRVYYSHRDARRSVSAIDVLDGKVEPERLAQKLVLIGMTGLGLLDYQLTPLRERMPGSEIHAQLLENFYDGTLLVRPRWATALELALFVLLGALLIWATPRWKPRDAAILAVACIALPVLGAWIAFRTHQALFDVATPALGLTLLFGLLLVLTLGETARQRKSLERVVQAQREEAAYVAGELKAAHRIQTGILPRADLLAGDRRIDLAATMTTAREVGGDLYDFFRLDGDRLFLLIGDVAGKGLSASMFMAVSKALYKSNVLRAAGATIGDHMTAANAEVSRDNSELFFVTAFGGILDLATGELTYCNAGQENPWLRAPGEAATRRLAGGGGPPLCAIDDYRYESARYWLRANEWLITVTDGVTEAQNTAGELYGTQRFESFLARLDLRVATAAGVVDAIRADVAAFVGTAEPSDDLTLLVLRWRGAGAAAS